MDETYEAVAVATNCGDVACRYRRTPEARAAALFVGGVGGGWDTPANGLYLRLAEDLSRAGIASLRVRFRHPTLLDEAVFDVLAGVAYLVDDAVERVALVGHSFGGAVVIQAGVLAEAVRTVVALSTQSYGADAARLLAPRCSLLLAHGKADTVLPPWCAEYVHEIAREPKRLVLYDDAGHGLEEVAEPVRELVRTWIVEKLSEAAK